MKELFYPAHYQYFHLHTHKLLGFGLWVLVLGFRLWVLGFGLWVLGFGLWALGFGLCGGFWVEGFGLRVELGVWGVGFLP